MKAPIASTQFPPLPLPRTQFVGREAERAAALSLLVTESVPLLTLTGPGGVGKTRLALTVANDVAVHFAEGVVFVDFSSLSDRGLVSTTVAGALGIASNTDQPITDAISLYLRSGQRLLVLDNCEHVLPELALLLAALLSACPALQVLATSRAPIHIHGEQLFPVPTLAVPPPGATSVDAIRATPAAALFVHRARSADPTFTLHAKNAEAVAAICRHMDGLPLALELAAARLAHLTPAAMVDLFGQQLHVLGTGARDAPVRQQTVELTIGWSYNLLAPEEQSVFRSLAVFSGGWTVDAAAAVTGLSTTRVLAHLLALADQSLIAQQPEPDGQSLRFFMLELIRTFAQAQLRGSPEELTAHDRHAAYFRDLAVARDLYHAFPGDPSWLEQITPEADNFRQALTRFLALGDIRSVGELSSSLNPFWLSNSLFSEGRRWLELSLHHDGNMPVSLRARVREATGLLINYHGEATIAGPLLEDAVALARESKDQPLLRDALQSLGFAKLLQHEYARAMEHFKESESVARAVCPGTQNGGRFLGAAIYLQGLAAQRSGAPDTAMDRFRAALPYFQEPGSNRRLGMVLGEIGIHQLGGGDLHEATSTLIEAVARIWSVRDDMAMTRSLRGLAIIAATTQQATVAAQLLGATDTLDASTPYGQVAVARDRVLIESLMAQLIDALGLITVNQERRVGAAMSVEQVVDGARLVASAAIGHERVDDIWQVVNAPYPEPASEVPSVRTLHDDRSARVPFDLTYREQEVLTLLGQRLTNAEIAARLFIEPSTVSTHVGNILDKIGAANRREAAAIAARHGLI